MKKNLQSSLKKFNDYFSKKPSAKMQSWSLLNDFYHLLMTYMNNEKISRAELAEGLGVSRSAISQLFNRQPNITLNKISNIANSIGLRLKLTSEQVEQPHIEKKIVIKSVPSFSLPNFREMEELQAKEEEVYPQLTSDNDFQVHYTIH